MEWGIWMKFWKKKLNYFLKIIFMGESELEKIIERVMGLVETTRRVIAYQQGRYNEQGLGAGLMPEDMLKASQGLTSEELQFLQDNRSFISDPEVLAFIGKEGLKPVGEGIDQTVAMKVIRIPELSEEEGAFNRVRGKIDVLMLKQKSGIDVSTEEELTDEEVRLFQELKTKYRRDINDGRRAQFLEKRQDALKPREAEQRKLNDSLRILTDMMRPAAERRDPAQNLTADGLLQVKRLALILNVELSREALAYIDAHTQAGSGAGDTQSFEIIKTQEKPARKSLWDRIRGK